MKPLEPKSKPKTKPAQSGSKQAVTKRQLDWAGMTNIPMASGYCVAPEQNLPWLTERIRNEVNEGDGKEFGKPGVQGKICALHSSSALGINFFGYWHSRDRTPLGKALGLVPNIESIGFERKFKTGVGPRSPNLDIVLRLSDGGILAIESKFTEWFGTSGRKPLRDAYLPDDKKRWTDVGLPGTQIAAETYMNDPGYTRLDVTQLLKHMLGLASQLSRLHPWRLMLLWNREPGTSADEMHKEIVRFKALLGVDSERFCSLTYQELWRDLKPHLRPADSEYARYMSTRYFVDTA